MDGVERLKRQPHGQKDTAPGNAAPLAASFPFAPITVMCTKPTAWRREPTAMHCNPFASRYTLKKRIPNVYSWLDQNYNYSDSICSGGDYWGYPNYFGRTSTGGTVTWYHKDLPSSIKNYVDNNPPEPNNWWDKYKASADIYITFRAHVEALFND